MHYILKILTKNVNLLINGNAETDVNADAVPDSWNTGATGSQTFNFTAPEVWKIKGNGTFEIRQNASDGTHGYFYQEVAVTPGKKYKLSGMVGAHRCSCSLAIQFKDATSTIIDSAESPIYTDNQTPTLSKVEGTAPANAVTAAILLFKDDTISPNGDSYGFFDEIYLYDTEIDTQYFGTAPGLTLDGQAVKNLMSIPTGNSRSITPHKHTATVSHIKCRITNPNSSMEVSKAFYNAIETEGIMFYREKAELYSQDQQGTQTLIFSGMIRGIKPSPYELEYDLEIADWFDELKKPVFQRELSEYSSESVANINTYRLPTGFTSSEADEGKKDQNNNTVLTRKITFNGSTSDFIKGFFNIMFSDEELQIGAGHLGTGWKDFVDETSIDSIIPSIDVSTLYFEWREPISSGFDFLKKQVYPLLSCYPYINSDMKIGLKIHQQPTVQEAEALEQNSALFVNEAVIEKVNSKDIDFSSLVNHILIKDRYNFSEEEYMESTYYTNGASFDKFKKLIPKNPLKYEFQGIAKYDNSSRDLALSSIRDRLFSRYAQHMVFLDVTIPLNKVAFSCGDYILFDNQFVVSWEGENKGLRGIASVDPGQEDPHAKFNAGDEWGGYLQGNQFAFVYGVEVVKLESEIKTELFKGQTGYKSIEENHARVDAWLVAEGY